MCEERGCISHFTFYTVVVHRKCQWKLKKIKTQVNLELQVSCDKQTKLHPVSVDCIIILGVHGGGDVQGLDLGSKYHEIVCVNMTSWTNRRAR